jgi:CHASE2 domain-containing sensor protein
VLKDRIVLIGARMIDRDKHSTPLSVLDSTTMPGVMVQAQVLAQRLDGDRDITLLPLWIVLPIVGGVGLLCFVAARQLSLSANGLIYQTSGLLIVGIASFLAFAYYRVDLPSIALATAWAGGAVGGWHSDWLYRQFGV